MFKRRNCIYLPLLSSYSNLPATEEISQLSYHDLIADWIEPSDGASHNFDSASSEGTNRFATLLLYLSEVEDGGETLFTEAGTYHSEDEAEALPYEDGVVRLSAASTTALETFLHTYCLLLAMPYCATSYFACTPSHLLTPLPLPRVLYVSGDRCILGRKEHDTFVPP